jgi:tryptophanyl-tRNA synthetase
MKKKDDFEVTPWEVRGEVDYNYLIEKFGVTPINDELKNIIRDAFGGLPKLIRRGVFFSHRDLDKVFKDYLSGRKPYLYTGRGPSGPMHIGHIISFYFTKELQEKFDTFVLLQFTSDEKYMYNPHLTPDKVFNYTIDNLRDVLAIGFDPEKTYVIEDLRHIKYLYSIAVTVAKRVTYSTVRAVFGFTPNTNIGMVFFASVQAAPAFLGYYIGEVHNCLIPAAIDQDPYWRVARDVADKIKLPKPSQIHSRLLPGLKKDVKMSSSVPESAIYLSDNEENVYNKLMDAFTGGQPTVALQREKGGDPDICVVFDYYKYLFEDDDKKLFDRYERCRSGQLLCGECKEELIERVNNFLKTHRYRKERIDENEMEKYMIDNKVDINDMVHKFRMLR